MTSPKHLGVCREDTQSGLQQRSLRKTGHHPALSLQAGETSGTTAGDAPATGEQSPRVRASWSVDYCIPCSNGFGWMAVRSCVAPPELVGQATWQGKSGQRRLHPLLAWWRRGGESPSHHSWERGWRKFSLAGARRGLALWAKVSGLCMFFRGCVCTLQKGCAWSRPGAETGNMYRHLENLQESFPLLSLC